MNILTIDFDIIMAPSIQLYNDIIKGNNEWTIENMAEIYPLLNYVEADFEIYQKLTNFLNNIAPLVDKEEIYFIRNHNDIIKYLPPHDDVTIYNIDHHHDITYGNPEDEIGYGGSGLGCGNWVKFLLDYNMIQDYIWIHNYTSAPPSDELMEKYPFDDEMCILYEDALDDIPTPDKIIISASFEWVPEKFAPLLYLWMDILGKMKRHNYWFEN